MMDDALKEPTYCPYCAKLIEGAMANQPGENARPGCIQLCLGCEKVSIFDAAMHLRRPTEDEHVAIAVSHGPEIIRMVHLIRHAKMLAQADGSAIRRN